MLIRRRRVRLEIEQQTLRMAAIHPPGHNPGKGASAPHAEASQEQAATPELTLLADALLGLAAKMTNPLETDLTKQHQTRTTGDTL